MTELSSWQRRGRSALNRFLYSSLSLRDAVLIAFGRAKPLVRFTVEASPPSLYLNFAVRPEELAAFEQYLALPRPLSQIACIEGDGPFHCLTLNVYRVSGIANGLRAEWSTYISDSTGAPRYMVVETQTEQVSLDAVDLFGRPGHVRYTDGGDHLSVEVGSEGDTMLTARLPTPTNALPVQATSDWVSANDFIYWRNGVCDRTFYDAGLADARIRSLDPAAVVITNDTPLSRYIDPTPRNVVVFENAIDLAISPWWNIDDPHL